MILNWLQEKINQKSKEKIYHTNVNVNLTIENVIQIKSRIVINVDVSIKHFMKENVHVFKMITGKNESEILTKDIWWECKWKFDEKKCNSDQKWNKNKCWCQCRKRHICGKECIWNPATCSSRNRKYLASIMDNSVITCDGIIDAVAKTYDK